METLFTSGRVVDLVIAVLLLEVVLVRGVLGRGDALPLATVASGMCLLLAWRAASSGADWRWIGLWLSSAGAAHAVDLRMRWQRTGPAARRPGPALRMLRARRTR
ncbi:MAG: hypothetical protein MUF30_10740 [Burkholderiales bacterium]|nr:hypothetical protein [Burkholderiales bacterium]